MTSHRYYNVSYYLINDGSKDNSGDEYAAKFLVYECSTKENGGVNSYLIIQTNEYFNKLA